MQSKVRDTSDVSPSPLQYDLINRWGRISTLKIDYSFVWFHRESKSAVLSRRLRRDSSFESVKSLAINQTENYLRYRCEKWVKYESNRNAHWSPTMASRTRWVQHLSASPGQRTGTRSQWFSHFYYFTGIPFVWNPTSSADRRKYARTLPSPMTRSLSLLSADQASYETSMVRERDNYELESHLIRKTFRH